MKKSHSPSLLGNGQSILSTFGKRGRLLKWKMAFPGFICRSLLFFISNLSSLSKVKNPTTIRRNRKNFAMKLLKFFFPFYTNGEINLFQSSGCVFVINHPTLNDPICAAICIAQMFPERNIMLPINLPWFENVRKYHEKLVQLGITLVPILTPKTVQRLGKDSYILEVQKVLIDNYKKKLIETLSGNGFIIVAQQATRKPYLFSNVEQLRNGANILPTVSLILSCIRRAKLLKKVCFIPIGIIPHKLNAKSGLNLFCKYTLNIGETILAQELTNVNNLAKRPADLHILLKLLELLPSEYHFDKRGK